MLQSLKLRVGAMDRRRAALFFLGMVLATFFLVYLDARAAFAATEDESAVVIAPFAITYIDVLRLLVVPVLLPAIVGAVNRAATMPSFVKRLLLAVLALASNVGAEFLAANDSGEPYNLWWALFLGVIAYAVAELTFQGFYKAPLNNGAAPVAHGALPAPAVEQKTLASVIAGSPKSERARG